MPAWLPPVVLAVLCLLLYGRVVGFGFTNWDDPTFIIHNPVLQQADAASLRGLFTPGSIPHEVLYIPMTYLSFWLERACFGLKPGVLHSTNLLLHLGNVLLLWGLLRLRSGAGLIAFAGALIFALHPLQVEAVAWCSGRKDLLATTAALLCLHAWQRRHSPLTIAFAAVAIFAKPTMLVLPALLLIWAPESWREHRRTLIAAAALSLVALLLNQSSVTLPADIPPLTTRLAHAPWIAGDTLLRFLLIEQPLHFYAWPESRMAASIGGLLIAGFAIMGMVWGWRRNQTGLWTGIAFSLLALAPMAKLLMGYREFVTADRYTYFPMIGVAIVVSGALSRLSEKRVPAASLIVGLLGLGMVALSWPQVSKWQDSVTLWRDYLDSQRSPFGYHQLGRAIRADHGDAQEALDALENARSLGGDSAELYYDLGAGYEDFGRHNAALDAYRETLARNPNFVEAVVNSANIFLARKEYDKAIILYDRALQFDTPFREAIVANRALAELQKK
jgi:tetratricopeptide (TPR) repeat protein